MKLTSVLRDEIAARYARGERIYVLAKEFGVDRTSISYLLDKRFPDRVRQQPKLTLDQRQEIATRYSRGERISALTKEFGLKSASVNWILKKYLPDRPKRKPKLTLDQRQEVITRYVQGDTVPLLAYFYKVHESSIFYILHRNGVELRKSSMWKIRRMSAEDRSSIVLEYRSGCSPNTIARSRGMSFGTIRRLLVLEGVPIRTHWEARYRLHVREDAFDVLTEEAAYWLGMLASDGNVSQTGNHVSLTLKWSDRDHVIGLKTFLDSEHKLGVRRHKNGTPYAMSLAFTSKHIAEVLASYGIVPCKSLILRIRRGLDDNKHFWRGYVDGDGWIGAGNESFLTLVSGSRALLEQFADCVKRIVPKWRGCVRQYRRRTFRVSLGAGTAEKVLEVLYAGCTIALPRKLQRARVVLQRVAQRAAMPPRPSYVSELPLIEQEEIIRLYRSGKSAAEVGRITGHTHRLVLQVTRAAGIPDHRYDPIQRDRIELLYREGATVSEVAALVGSSPVTVLDVLHARNVPMRAKGRQVGSHLRRQYQTLSSSPLPPSGT